MLGGILYKRKYVRLNFNLSKVEHKMAVIIFKLNLPLKL